MIRLTRALPALATIFEVRKRHATNFFLSSRLKAEEFFLILGKNNQGNCTIAKTAVRAKGPLTAQRRLKKTPLQLQHRRGAYVERDN